MKKWSSTELVVNCDDDSTFTNNVKFTYTPVNDDGTYGETITFFTWENFFDIMLERYTDFNYLTGSYHSSVSNSEVEICDTFAKALAKFKKSVNTFVLDKQNAFEKLFMGLYKNYDPTNNVDIVTESTTDYKGKEITVETPSGTETNTLTKAGKETNTNTPTGTETDTLTKSGKETTTETPTGTETTTLTKSGKEVNKNTPVGSETKTKSMSGTETNTETPSGSETVTHNIGAKTNTTGRTTYDDSNFKNTEQVSENARIDSDVTTYSSKQVQNVKSFTNRQDSETTTYASRETTDELSFTNRQDSEVKSFTNRETETETSFDNRQDTNVKSFTNRQTVDEKTFTNRTDTNVKSFDDRQTETEKSFTNRQDEMYRHMYGLDNAYKVTIQDLINQQFTIAELDEIRQYIVNCFVHKYLVI